MGLVTSIGLDLSLTASGVAVSRRRYRDGEDTPYQAEFALGLVGEDKITNLSMAEQIGAIDRLTDLILERVDLRGRDVPAVVVIEALDNGYTYGGATERSVLWWQVVRRFVTMAGDSIEIYMPTSAQAKIYATGNGNASKPAMIAAVKEHWPWWEVGKNDNKADAAAMCELGWALGGGPSKAMPTEHSRVLPRIRKVTDPPARMIAKKPIARKAKYE